MVDPYFFFHFRAGLLPQPVRSSIKNFCIEFGFHRATKTLQHQAGFIAKFAGEEGKINIWESVYIIVKGGEMESQVNGARGAAVKNGGCPPNFKKKIKWAGYHCLDWLTQEERDDILEECKEVSEQEKYEI